VTAHPGGSLYAQNHPQLMHIQNINIQEGRCPTERTTAQ